MSALGIAYVRFTTTRLDPESGYPSGLFVAAWEVRDDDRTEEYDRERLREHLRWFGSHLDEPDRFWRSRSKGASCRNWRGLSWFKSTSAEHITRMHEVGSIVAEYDWQHSMIRTKRPGFIVYEDEVQVVAEPFADTPLS